MCCSLREEWEGKKDEESNVEKAWVSLHLSYQPLLTYSPCSLDSSSSKHHITYITHFPHFSWQPLTYSSRKSPNRSSLYFMISVRQPYIYEQCKQEVVIWTSRWAKKKKRGRTSAGRGMGGGYKPSNAYSFFSIPNSNSRTLLSST